jgi:hypothetical protein
MTEAKNIFKAVIDASLEAARVMDIGAVEANTLVCENLIAVFDEMHVSSNYSVTDRIITLE